MIRSSRLASVALLAAFASAAAQRSTIARDGLRAARRLARLHLSRRSRAPSAAFAVIRGNDTLAYGAHGLADVAAWRAPTAYDDLRDRIDHEAVHVRRDHAARGPGQAEARRRPLEVRAAVPAAGEARVDPPAVESHVGHPQLHVSSPEWQKTWNDELSPDAIVKFVAADTFDFAPGAAYRYNNTGYVLLGMVIEKATGQKYANYLDAQFFKPLGLRQTSYCPSKTTESRVRARLQQRTERHDARAVPAISRIRSPRARCARRSATSRSGSARSTAERWCRAASYALMTTADTLNSGRKINYGFGLVPGVFNGHKTISHTGGINGFATAATYVPDDSLSIVVFTNYDAESPQTLVQNLLRVAYGVAPVGRVSARATQAGCSRRSRPPIATRSSAITRCSCPAGRRCRSSSSWTARASWRRRRARTRTSFGTSGTTRSGSGGPAIRFTFTIDGGKATKVTLLQGGATMEGPRVP